MPVCGKCFLTGTRFCVSPGFCFLWQLSPWYGLIYHIKGKGGTLWHDIIRSAW